MPPSLVLGVFLAHAPPEGPASSAADAVTLRDGSVALGQIHDQAPRGKVILLVRRDWAEAHLPDWARRWEAAEASWARKARRERLRRLVAWRRDRGAESGKGDVIAAWLVAEIARLGDDAAPIRSPLMAVQLPKADVRSVVRRPKEVGRLLRQGWLAGFDDAEALPIEKLRDALEGRGFARAGDDGPSVDALLPIPPETEAHWLVRRAATEVAHDPGLRFVRYQGLVYPEPPPGAPPDLSVALGALKGLLGEANDKDPMARHLRAIAARRGVGLVLTRLDLGPDLARPTVEATLWVRGPDDRWRPAVARSATVDPRTIPKDQAAPLGDDPQVKSVFDLVAGLGLEQVVPDLKRQGLAVGEATRQALARAREAIDRDLDALALPVDAVGQADRPRDQVSGSGPP